MHLITPNPHPALPRAPKTPSMRRTTKLLLASLAVAGLAACGSSSDRTPTASAQDPSQPAPTSTVAKVDCTMTKGQTITVDIGAFVFSPTPVKVHQCDSVVWKNTHTQAHTSTGNAAQSWATGNLDPGVASAPVLFASTGSFSYICSLHPFMTGVVEVS
jgi:plastocyanin